MPAASAIRMQIESALAARIPAALTPAPRMVRPVAATGIDALDEVVRGGLPVGALTELVGPECSGRTSVALKFVAGLTQAGRVCAWIDVSNALDPASAAAAGVDLERLLWVRCGAAKPATPRAPQRFSLPEKYLTPAAGDQRTAWRGLRRPPTRRSQGTGPRRERTFAAGDAGTEESCRPMRRAAAAANGRPPKSFEANHSQVPANAYRPWRAANVGARPWAQLDQALRATDLVLQAGGFSAIVLDLGGLTPEFASRVPLATWFRYRAAAEKTQASILLLAQYGCAKSSAELSLRLEPGDALARRSHSIYRHGAQRRGGAAALYVSGRKCCAAA